MGDEGESFFSAHKWQILLGVLALLAIGMAVFFTFGSATKCDTYACFQEHMATCTRAEYINEEPEASWRYSIAGKEAGECSIHVTLLQAKQGDLELDLLKGYQMECRYPVGVTTYPDSDLGACSGRLKEELQGIVIKKLYDYILDNLGDLDQSLTSAI